MPDAAAKDWRQHGLGNIAETDLRELSWGGLKPGTKLGELGPVFPRAEKETVERMQELEDKRAPQSAPEEEKQAKTLQPEPAASESDRSHATSLKPPAAVPHKKPIPDTQPVSTAAAVSSGTVQDPAAPPPANPSPATDKISIDDFSRVDLRVAVVRAAERVPKADRLLRLEVDLGSERRQILAGIAEAYAPESLIGRKVVVVANLAPRKLRGLESNGMIVAATGEDGKPILAGFLEDVDVGARLK
jgi:methionyl-tRNA synthetase